MKNLNLLVVEGNIQKENESFKQHGIPTHSESLKESLSYYTNELNIDVFNQYSEKSFDKILPKIKNSTSDFINLPLYILCTDKKTESFALFGITFIITELEFFTFLEKLLSLARISPSDSSSNNLNVSFLLLALIPFQRTSTESKDEFIYR